MQGQPLQSFKIDIIPHNWYIVHVPMTPLIFVVARAPEKTHFLEQVSVENNFYGHQALN